MPHAAPRGLTASELQAAVAELQGLVGCEVLDVAPLQWLNAADDLLLVFAGAPKQFLLLAPGGTRARLCLTNLRFRREERRSGPAADRCASELIGARLVAITAAPGERRGSLTFCHAAGPRTLAFELFGARGLWALLDATDHTLAMSREVVTAVRNLRMGDRYAPPPPAATEREPEPRFCAPVLARIDQHFADQDQASRYRSEHETLLRAAERAAKRAAAQVRGLQQQLLDAERAILLREEADLMLAYSHQVARGSEQMTVIDPTSGNPRNITLDPAVPVLVQAQHRYERARRWEEGKVVAGERIEKALLAQQRADAVVEQLAQFVAPTSGTTAASLAPLRETLRELGALPKPPAPPQPKAKRIPPGENFRRFVSTEGYSILVGRDNTQNDRLTLRVAAGNDVWLHVGGGRPGSHVVIRLPKAKTASLESLLDAAALAVHFSKARGELRIDVIYTLAKHVRKAKGLPPGAVLPSHEKTLVSHLDAARLQRLLSSAADSD